MRDAFSILDMCVSAAPGGLVTAAVTRDVLGTSDRDFLFAFGETLAAGDAAGVLRGIDQLMRAGREPQVFLKEMTRHIRALLTVRVVAEYAATILEVTDEDERRYRAQAERFAPERLLRVMDGLMRAESELRYAGTPRLGLEVAMLRACADQKGEDTAALLERIAELEAKLGKLADALESGRYAAPDAPRHREAQPADAKQDAPAAPKAPPKAPPTGEQEIWTQALALLLKTEAPLCGLIKKERFLGAKGDVYRVAVAFERKEFSLVYLNRQASRDSVSKALSEVAGKPLGFEAVLDGDGCMGKESDLREENIRALADTVGRDLLQVDEGNAEKP